MKALVLHEFGGRFQLEEVPIPRVGPGEALVKVRACGIGLTVDWIRQGVLGGSVPRIMGHEVAGDVAEVAQGVKNVKVGDRVIVYFYFNCGVCEFCRKGRESLCANFGGFVGAHRDGGYADYIKVPAENLLPIPNEIAYVEASIIADAIGTPIHCIRERAQVRPLDDVMVVGAGGGVGIHAVQMARLCGGRVLGVDLTEEKLATVKELGADEVINAAKVDFAEEARRLTGGKGVDVVIDFVGSTESLAKSFRALGTGGKLVILASYPGASMNLTPISFIFQELVVMGSRYVTKAELAEAIEIVRQGRIKPVVSQTFPLEKVEEAHQLLAQNKITGRAAMVM